MILHEPREGRHPVDVENSIIRRRLLTQVRQPPNLRSGRENVAHGGAAPHGGAPDLFSNVESQLDYKRVHHVLGYEHNLARPGARAGIASPGRPRYNTLSCEASVYRDPNAPSLRYAPIEQLWREQMLVAAMLETGAYDTSRMLCDRYVIFP